VTDARVPPLSERQQLFLTISVYNEDSEPGAVRLMSSSDWRTARSLVKRELGRIEHDAGEQGKFIANDVGAQVVHPGRQPPKRRR
jgi:hypothetical protein